MEIIHIVLGQANPNRMNGVNKVVHELATQQTLHGQNVSVWGITANTAHDYPARNFETVLFKAYKNKFKLDATFLPAAIAKGNNVVYHIHGGFNPTFYSVAKALHGINANYIFTPHGAYNTIALQRSKWIKKIYFSLFEKQLLRYAQAIHCLGKSEVDGVQLLYKNNKAKLAPYGFELNTLAAIAPTNNQFIIGFCGRIDMYTKGLDLLLKAFAEIKPSIPNANLWLVGDGAEMSALKALVAQLGLEGDVKFFGSLYNTEKFDVLKQFNVFAHPSRNEGLPSAVLEAASLGIPCVVTEATNIGNAITKYNAGKSIVNPNVKELADAFKSMHADIQYNGYQLLSNNAKQMVVEEFNWSRVIEQFNAIYQNAA